MNYEVWEKLNKNNRLIEIFFTSQTKLKKFLKKALLFERIKTFFKAKKKSIFGKDLTLAC
jgi:hypothetical protein